MDDISELDSGKAVESMFWWSLNLNLVVELEDSIGDNPPRDWSCEQVAAFEMERQTNKAKEEDGESAMPGFLCRRLAPLLSEALISPPK